MRASSKGRASEYSTSSWGVDMSIVITGAVGALARIVARKLRNEDDLVGIDLRPLHSGRRLYKSFHHLKRYNQRRAAEIFRSHRPRALLHLGMRGASARSLNARYTQNVLGTRHLLHLCSRYGVERVTVLGTYHVYGAHQHNPVNIREDAPLRASQIFPQIADIVELDHAVTHFMWRHGEVSTILLRPVNIVGPSINNQITRLLRSQRCPILLGFNPMEQFIHEEDAADAIILAHRGQHTGVYNVAGEGALPYAGAVRLAGGRTVPIPHVLAYPVVGALSRWRLTFPKHLMDYFRYATIIDDGAFRADFGWEPRYSLVETLGSLQFPARHA